jgi:hypothetical protein
MNGIMNGTDGVPNPGVIILAKQNITGNKYQEKEKYSTHISGNQHKNTAFA